MWKEKIYEKRRLIIIVNIPSLIDMNLSLMIFLQLPHCLSSVLLDPLCFQTFVCKVLSKQVSISTMTLETTSSIQCYNVSDCNY